MINAQTLPTIVCGLEWRISMDNNDILIRLRYALDIRDADMMEIFSLGGVKVTKNEVLRMLINPKRDESNRRNDDEFVADKNLKLCNNHIFEAFLNGLIIFKRGEQEIQSTESEKQVYMIKDYKAVNNVMLKKIKIALSLTSEDMLDIFKETGIILSKSELSAVLRREGQRNYKECGDRYARNFLKGLAIKYKKKEILF